MRWGGMVQLVNLDLVQHPLLSANMTVLFEAHRPIDAVFQLEKIFLRL